VADYLKIIGRNPEGNFSEAKIVYVKARYRKKQLRLIRTKMSAEGPGSIKTIRRIKRMHIIDVVFNPAIIAGSRHSSGGLIIYYT